MTYCPWQLLVSLCQWNKLFWWWRNKTLYANELTLWWNDSSICWYFTNCWNISCSGVILQKSDYHYNWSHIKIDGVPNQGILSALRGRWLMDFKRKSSLFSPSTLHWKTHSTLYSGPFITIHHNLWIFKPSYVLLVHLHHLEEIKQTWKIT